MGKALARRWTADGQPGLGIVGVALLKRGLNKMEVSSSESGESDETAAC